MPSEMVKEAMSPYTRETNWYTKFFQGRHKDLNEFKSHVISFTDIKTVAVQKGIEQSFDINIAHVSKNSNGGVDVYSIRTQDCWSHKRP